MGKKMTFKPVIFLVKKQAGEKDMKPDRCRHSPTATRLHAIQILF